MCCIGFSLLAWAWPASAATAAPDFAAFETRFRAAVQRNDAAGVAALSQRPFLFEGRAHDTAGFVREVWPQLFRPAVRRCLVQAPARPEGAERVMFCAPYSFHFDAAGGAWRLREFSADGEDAGP